MGEHFREKEDKITLGMIVAGVAIIAILITSLVVYLLSSEDKNTGEIKLSESSNVTNTLSESTSFSIGKTVNEVENEMSTNEIESNTVTNMSTNTSKKEVSKTEENVMENNNDEDDETEETNSKVEDKEDEEITFVSPIKGEVLKDFAADSLIFSETLQEWVTHKGVDIKADKTSVVSAAAKGTVTAIKNDPRYGLTVIVSHKGGYKTVYANLLTAEFVVEGEEIEAEQTIGTVGNSATFEIADDYHLHFELLKDDENINPSNYMEF